MTTPDSRGIAASVERRIATLDEQRAALLAEAAEVLERTDGDPADQQRYETIEREIDELDKRRAGLERIARSASAGRLAVESGDGAAGAVTERDGAEDVHTRARRTLDDINTRTGAPEDGLARAEALLTSPDPRSRGIAAEWVACTGDPHYEAAFLKLLSDPDRGHLLWTEREADAFRQVQMFRAMSLTDASGGYMVPFQLDPSVMLTSDGSINPIRQVARTVVATGDVWHGVSSAGVTAEWLAEATEAADASPTLAQPQVPIYKGSAFVPFSYEVGMDAANFMEELRRLLVDGADQLQATAFTTGTGTGEPTGIITALTGTGSVVTSAATDTFASSDVYSVQEALGPRFQPRARWLANLAILNTIDQFETTSGAKKFPQVGDGMLLRKPVSECSNMDGSITALADNYVLLYGDFTHYVIADRIGTTLELIPNLFGANRRPTGQRGAFLWFRTGADSVVDEAFTVLNVT